MGIFMGAPNPWLFAEKQLDKAAVFPQLQVTRID
jgi:hypothetical protein